ncbi:MAG: glycosyltransferase [Acidimicrobiales bacterium]
MPSLSSPLTFGILSSFPPTPCGLATFSAALATGLVAGGNTVDVVRCGAAPELEDASVVAGLDDGPRAAAEALNATDVVIVQHEYGLYDGRDGESLLDLLAAVDVPIIVVAHTVLATPSENQRTVLRQVCRAADAVVVMTENARGRLVEGFDVDPTIVSVIAHGAATPPPDAESVDQGRRSPLLLTWGLLGPGKGIEWAIDAVAALGDLPDPPHYLIAGATHPKVLATSGEAYRDMLITRAWSSGAAPRISFDDTYRDLPALTELIRSADIVVLPYDSVDQVTSGVLVDAVAAGRPVVSTAFPHAVELLASGAGLAVPQRDPVALERALRWTLEDRRRSEDMAAEARRLAPSLSWPNVASTYRLLAGRLLADAAVAW